MQMFRWYSSALRQHRDGSIIVMAADVDAAREKVRAMMGPHYRGEYLMIGEDEAHYLLEDMDGDDVERWIEWRDKVETDIAKDPVTDDVFFIRGSE